MVRVVKVTVVLATQNIAGFFIFSLSIYAKISGSEMEGGLFKYDFKSKKWYYKWNVLSSGTYKIKALLLYLNGDADFDKKKCNIRFNTAVLDTPENNKYIINEVPKNWHFFSPVENCCEWCARLDGKCQLWMSSFRNINKRCILYSNSS